MRLIPYLVIVLVLVHASVKTYEIYSAKPKKVTVGYVTPPVHYYVVAGSFKEEASAQKYVHSYSEHFPNIIHIKGYYRIVLYKTLDKNVAQQLKAKLKFKTIIIESI
jgi:hypothetical protein